jgi:hypothetical protein
MRPKKEAKDFIEKLLRENGFTVERDKSFGNVKLDLFVPEKNTGILFVLTTDYKNVVGKSERLKNTVNVKLIDINQLDAGKLYTIPQPDAKILWLMKRVAPSLYIKLLGIGYPIFNKYLK